MADKYILVIQCQNITTDEICALTDRSCMLSKGSTSWKFWYDTAAKRESAKKAIESGIPAATFLEFPEAKPAKKKSTKKKLKTEETEDGLSTG